MKPGSETLGAAVDSVMDNLPHVWDCIRGNLRSAATKRFGITLEQFHTLRHIRMGYRSVKDLADKRQVSRPAVSQAIEVLVRKGLVDRTQDKSDRRYVELSLTPWASGILDGNLEENKRWMESRMSGLAEDELETVRKAMETLSAVFVRGEI